MWPKRERGSRPVVSTSKKELECVGDGGWHIDLLYEADDLAFGIGMCLSVFRMIRIVRNAGKTMLGAITSD